MQKRKVDSKKCPECGCNLKLENYARRLKNVHHKKLIDKEIKSIEKQIAVAKQEMEMPHQRKRLLKKGYLECGYCKRLVKPKALKCTHCGKLFSSGKKSYWDYNSSTILRNRDCWCVYYTQMQIEEKKSSGVGMNSGTASQRPVAPAFGMALVFFIIGGLISYCNIFTQDQDIAMAFIIVAGIVLILFGLDSIGAFTKLKKHIRSNIRQRTRTTVVCLPAKASSCVCKPQKKGFIERLRLWGLQFSKNYLLMGSFFLGMLFSLAWMPCAVGLILPVILLLMTQKLSMLMGGLLLFVFGLGHAIPFLPIASAASAVSLKITDKMIHVGKWLMGIFGIIIIVLGANMILTALGFDLWKWW